MASMLTGAGQAVVQVYSEPSLWVGAALILVLERLRPARPGQPVLRVGLLHDVVWLGIQTAAHVLVLAVYLAFLTRLYDRYLGALTISAVGTLPTAARWTLWILAVDLFEWCHHRIKHAVPWFWQFHAVHHSQPELNLFTDSRYHTVEYLVSKTAMTFPLLILQADLAQITYFTLLHGWYTRVIHAGIRSDFGALRHVLVTPQSHRIHHSIEPAHTDKNFGTIFSVWDRLFGTQHRGWHEYPETGIRDRAFPVERSAGTLVTTLLRQHLYPFGAVLRTLRLPARIQPPLSAAPE